MTLKITAQLFENRLVVWDPDEGSALYNMGFYGKPVGIAKPKPTGFTVPLMIDLIEGLYLLEKRLIRVRRTSRGRGLGIKSFRKYARGVYTDFDLDYLVYRDLREHGYVVLPGIKFGCEYAVYEQGPGIDHAPYMVSVRKRGAYITATDIVRAGRLATSVRKRFIIAVPNLVTGLVQYHMFKWFKA